MDKQAIIAMQGQIDRLIFHAKVNRVTIEALNKLIEALIPRWFECADGKLPSCEHEGHIMRQIEAIFEVAEKKWGACEDWEQALEEQCAKVKQMIDMVSLISR